MRLLCSDEEGLTLYGNSGWRVEAADDDRGKDWRAEEAPSRDERRVAAARHLKKATAATPRMAFFQGYQDHDLSTALDVEGEGRAAGAAGLRHGCTSLILQTAGTTTTLHFDTGPYCAISFHLLGAPLG